MILNLFMLLYRALWVLLLPLVLIYIWRRGRRDGAYTDHLGERFGFYKTPLPQNPLWFHAVSLGETRSAVGLIRLALARGDTVVVTHFTPAGRAESHRQFADEIASGQLAAIWVPLDMFWCFNRFFRACRPRLGLTLEIEIWPAMILAARANGVPLYPCNAQYPTRSIERDSKGLRLRQRVIACFAGAFVKSDLQAQRFASVGLGNITATGELRFDQPIPPALIDAANDLLPSMATKREIVTIASGVEGEEPLFADMITQVCTLAETAGRIAPLFVYVPRAPERFDAVARDLRDTGLRVLSRSDILDADLRPIGAIEDAQVLVGDSLGEMFFYLALADRVIVGGGFTPQGAHNIIEPLMLTKPVLTGPHIWTIEFPFLEAQAAGIAQSLPDKDALIAALTDPQQAEHTKIEAFLAQHRGASARTLGAIDVALAHGQPHL